MNGIAAKRLAGSMDDVIRSATRSFTDMTAQQPIFLPIGA
jgi:hypothetical protein